MATRVDAARLEELIDANGLLARDLATAQERSTRVAAEQARVIEQLQSTIVRLRGELASAATLLSQGREQLQALEDAAPGLRSRFELALENERLLGRMHELQRSQLRWHQEAERQRRRADEVTPPSPPPSSPQAGSCNVVGAGAALRDRSVLCVGGRPASVPFYRRVIERTGGRFLHHDGGDEDNVVQLDATLDSADLVICQTGCISHDAYWRVKDHCKRTGKPCVFVESPSRAGLERALGLVRPTAPPNDD